MHRLASKYVHLIMHMEKKKKIAFHLSHMTDSSEVVNHMVWQLCTGLVATQVYGSHFDSLLKKIFLK